MSDLERCDICGNPMSLDNSEDATVCNAKRCYTALVRAKAAARGVSVAQALIDDPSLAAGLEVAKAVHPVELFDEASGDVTEKSAYKDLIDIGVSEQEIETRVGEGYRVIDLLAAEGGLDVEFIAPNPQLELYALGFAEAELRMVATLEDYGTLPLGSEPDRIPHLPPGTKLVQGRRRTTMQNPAFSAPYGQADQYISSDGVHLPVEISTPASRDECSVADAELSRLQRLSQLAAEVVPEDPDDERARLRREVADLQGALGRVQHVAEEKARYWEIRCEYAEVALADVAVSLAWFDLTSDATFVVAAHEHVNKALADRETRGIEDLEKTLRDRRQVRIAELIERLWGETDRRSPVKRVIRLFEESVEALQAVAVAYPAQWLTDAPGDNWWAGWAFKMIDRVAGKPAGSPAEELGDVLWTANALAEALQLSAQEQEVAAVMKANAFNPAVAAAKHQSKLDGGF